jgi:(p)ppGpp synthase/HD superfamily hydrolase
LEGAGVFKVLVNGQELSRHDKIADVIADHKAVVRNFNYNMTDGMFEGILNIMVPNSDVLHGIMRKIQGIKGILKVTRYDNS